MSKYGKNHEENLKINNPKMICILRDSEKNIIDVDSMNNGIREYILQIEFDEEKLDSVYEINLNGYYFRAINFKVPEFNNEYVQILINIDSEKNTINNYSNILVISIILSAFLCFIASVIVSKKSMKPIINAWNKQTEFIQNASHELRTPLTIIQAKQEMLLEYPNSKIIDKSEDILLTLNETKRLSKLTKDLMTLARADSIKMEVSKEKVYIDSLIEKIVTPYTEMASLQGKQIKLNLNYKNEVNVDVNKIYQLMIILLDNAIKYTEINDEIIVETYLKENKCIINVKDTGIGINNETIQRIFERFYREDKARNRETGGSGLGLAIAEVIVKSHNGTIKVNHNEPKGTIFTIKLPK